MHGPYIHDRLFPKLVSEAGRLNGATVTTFSDDWIVLLEKNGIKYWAIGYSFDLNPSGASTIARDKVACYQVLVHDGIPAIEHYLLRSRSQHRTLIENIPEEIITTPAVIKPLFGTGGVGVQLLTSANEAVSFLETDPHPDWALSPFYNVVSEIRLIVCDGKILCAYKKTNPAEKDGLRLFNLGLGANAVDIDPDKEHVRLATRAMKSIGLRIASVDIAILENGASMVMEINDGITMERYARQSGENMKVTRSIYAVIVEKMLV